MARASTVTKLPLTTWAKLMRMHPLHFEQVRLTSNPHCDQIMFQHPWQTADHVSREDIAQAIAEAESKIENYLQYRLAPSWEVDEWRDTIRPYQKELVNYNNRDVRGYQQTVPAKWGYMISGGIKTRSLIAAGATIVYTDEDSDNYFETATVIVPTVVIDPNEVCAVYPDKEGDESWEIRPINVAISGGNTTITFRREQAVIADLFDRFDIEGAEADGYDDDDFLETVDIYRCYNDPQVQASMLWEPLVGACGFCGGAGCASCAYSIQSGCLIVRGDPRQSILGYHPADWNQQTLSFDTASYAINRQPDIVRLYYYAGWRNKSQRYINRMDPEWERTVAYMASALLDRPPCDCVAGDWNKWRQDLTIVAGDEDGHAFFRAPTGSLDNPFGTRRGEVYAWRKVKDLMRGRAVPLE